MRINQSFIATSAELLRKLTKLENQKLIKFAQNINKLKHK